MTKAERDELLHKQMAVKLVPGRHNGLPPHNPNAAPVKDAVPADTTMGKLPMSDPNC